MNTAEQLVSGTVDIGSITGLFVETAFFVNYIFDSLGSSDFLNGITTFEVESLGSIVCTVKNICSQTRVGSIEFFASATFLAGVDNPFPNYSPVPIPISAFLFGSALLGLAGTKHRKTGLKKA